MRHDAMYPHSLRRSQSQSVGPDLYCNIVGIFSYFKYITRRRMSCHQYTQMLWDALKMIRNSRGQPTTEKIMKLMQKEFGSNESEVTKQLDNCVRDGLLEVTKKTVSKGPNAGSEQCFYRLPLLKVSTTVVGRALEGTLRRRSRQYSVNHFDHGPWGI